MLTQGRTSEIPSEPEGTIIITPRDLRKKEHGAVLCYPGTDLSSFQSRVSQLKSLGVKELILEGESKIGKYGIVGRGCVSTVVKARLASESDVIALKLRRIDANRSDMSHDFELQKFANSFGVGPRAIALSRDLFAMEFVGSVKLGKYCQSLRARSSKRYLRSMIRNALEQCYLLDMHGLDHGELSNPTKHVLIRTDSAQPVETEIIDYESASRNRRVCNLTSVAQFFLLGGWQSVKVKKILGTNASKDELLLILRAYKKEPNKESLEKLFYCIKC